jgi:hypothetical protein
MRRIVNVEDNMSMRASRRRNMAKGFPDEEDDALTG